MSSISNSNTSTNNEVTYYIQKTRPEQHIDTISSTHTSTHSTSHRATVVQPQQTPKKQQFHAKHNISSKPQQTHLTKPLELLPQISSPLSPSKLRNSPRILLNASVKGGTSHGILSNNTTPTNHTYHNNGIYVHNILHNNSIPNTQQNVPSTMALAVHSILPSSSSHHVYNNHHTYISSPASSPTYHISPTATTSNTSSNISNVAHLVHSQAKRAPLLTPQSITSGDSQEVVVANGDGPEIVETTQQTLVSIPHIVDNISNKNDIIVLSPSITNNTNIRDISTMDTPITSNTNICSSCELNEPLQHTIDTLQQDKTSLQLKLRLLQEEYTRISEELKSINISINKNDEIILTNPSLSSDIITNNSNNESTNNLVFDLKIELKSKTSQIILLKQELADIQHKQKCKEQIVRKDQEYIQQLEEGQNQLKLQLQKNEQEYDAEKNNLAAQIVELQEQMEHKQLKMNAKEKDALYFVFQQRVQNQVKRLKTRFTSVELKLQQALQKHVEYKKKLQLEQEQVSEKNESIKHLSMNISSYMQQLKYITHEKEQLSKKVENIFIENIQWKERLEYMTANVELLNSRIYEQDLNTKLYQEQNIQLKKKKKQLCTKLKHLCKRIHVQQHGFELQNIKVKLLAYSNQKKQDVLDNYVETIEELHLEVLDWKTRALKAERALSDRDILSSFDKTKSNITSNHTHNTNHIEQHMLHTEESIQLSGDMHDFMQGNWEHVVIETLPNIGDAFGDSFGEHHNI